MPGNFVALEAARLARGGTDPFAQPVVPAAPVKLKAFIRTDFAVGKVYDDGRFVEERVGMTRDTAEAMAGRLRDAMTDDEVAKSILEGWTYGYKAVRGNIGRPRIPFIPREDTPEQRQERGRKAAAARWGDRMKDAMGSVNKPGFAGMTPERRREISAKANAARAIKLTAARRSEIASKARAAIDPEVSRSVALRATAARMAK